MSEGDTHTRDGYLNVGYVNVDSGSFTVIDPDEFRPGLYLDGVSQDFVDGLMENANPHLVGGLTISYQGECQVQDGPDGGAEFRFDRKPTIHAHPDWPGQEGEPDYKAHRDGTLPIRRLFITDPCYIMGRSERSGKIRHQLHDEAFPGVLYHSGLATGGDGSWLLEASEDGLHLRIRIDAHEQDRCSHVEDGAWASCDAFWDVEVTKRAEMPLGEARMARRSGWDGDRYTQVERRDEEAAAWVHVDFFDGIRACHAHAPALAGDPIRPCTTCGGAPTGVYVVRYLHDDEELCHVCFDSRFPFNAVTPEAL